MSLTAAHLDALVEAGVTAAQIVALVKADLIEREQKVGARRERDAERQRRHRESRVVTVTLCDPAPNERDNLTPTRETKTEAKASSKSLINLEKRQAIASCLRAAFPPPFGVSDEQWVAFGGQRKKKLNDRSYLLLCNKLARLAEDGWPPGEMIDRAIENGWETVWPPRNQQNGNVTSLQRNRPNLTALLRASSSDPESGFGTRPALPASGNG